ncbi:MAG: SPFH/Band 7/PHB domain protein [Chloroflexi bacterium]|nr:SPFH/Band 7/PHB domain protein [Chloroflexota bacterium]
MFFIRIVRQFERVAVFRLGRFMGMKGPGLVILIPFIDRASKVDLREEVIDIPRQTNITRDNAPIGIDFLVYMRVMEETAQRSVLEVMNYHMAVIGIATTTLRAVIGDIPLDDVLSKREQINTVLRVKLDEVTERWGIKVTGVEIREIEPPREIQEAMNRQMAAERNRRAVITEAEGQKQANVTVAEGQKQAAILQAEGSRQAAILNAEGDRQAAILRAEGFSSALDKIFAVAKTIDANTLSLQYFQTLKDLGASPSTKFIFPMEFTGLLKPFVDMAAKRDNSST